MAKGLPYSVTIQVQGDLHVGIYSNGGEILTQLDLSEINLKFLPVGSTELKTFFSRIANNTGVLNLDNKIASPLYALVPINHGQGAIAGEFLFSRIQEAILLACPSLFRLLFVLIFQKRGDSDVYDLTAQSPYTANTNTPFEWEDIQIDAKMFSEFIVFYVKHSREKKFLKTPIKYYINNFVYANREGMAMSYINLSIALEGMLSANNEITYRLSRFCAVLNSSSHEMGETIFKNTKKIYSLRSEIAHNGTFHDDVIDEYREYLVNLVSCTVMLLLQSDIKSTEELDDIVTKHGYGDKAKLFPRVTFTFVENESKFGVDLPKYKRAI